MKRLLPLFLALCMVLSLLTVGAAAAETRDGLTDGYYLMGTHNNWDAADLTEDLRFHESLGDPAEFILETDLALGQEFKVVKVENGAVTAWYPDGTNNNYVVDAAHAGPAILYFRDTYYNDWAANGGHVWVGGKPAVSYVDENGETQTCTDYTTANYAGAAWSGWIVLNENVTLNSRVTVNGDANLILEDRLTLNAKGGILIPAECSLTVYAQTAGTGALNADIDYDFGDPDFDINLWLITNSNAAIGADNNEDGGELTINGGVITVVGGAEAAGIGGGLGSSMEKITINGGAITASGAGDCGDGIGAGDSANDCPDIVINGGTVTAYGGGSGAGIGCHHNAELVINGGTVTAYGGVSDAGVGAAGIGGDYVNMNAGTITINGGVVNAYGGDGTASLRGGAGIGGASGGDAGVITINGGVVNAVGGEQGGAGIGPGAKSYVMPSDPGSITITGGQVTASSANAAGIGFSGMFTPNNGDPIPVNTAAALGWTEQTDFILSDSYAGSVTLIDDWAVEGSDETFSAGTVEDNAALASKKLIPPTPVILDPIENRDLHVYNSISVGTDMVITFTARKTDLTNYADFWIEVVKHNPDGDVTYTYNAEDMTEGTSTWSVQFRNIYAKEMGVDVEARLYAEDANGQIYMSPAKNANIRDYLGGRLTATNNKVQQRVLAADMLNYGAAAQLFMDFQTDHLVNEELTADQLAKLHEYEATELPAVNKTNSNYRPEGESNILFTSVTLGNEVLLNLTVRLAEGTEGVQVLVKDHATGETVKTLDTAWGSSTFSATFNGIGADAMRTEFDLVTIVNGVETGNTRTWSVEAYVGEVRAENRPLKVAMANALLTYGDSAAAYFAAQ